MASNASNAIKSTAKHGAIYGMGQAAPQLVGFFLLPLFARYLTPAEFGIWALLQSVATVSQSLFIIGLDTACMRSYHDYDTEKSQSIVVGSAVIMLFFSVIIFNIVAQTCGGYISLFIFKSQDYLFYLRLIIVASSFKLFKAIPLVVFRAKHKSKTFITIQSGSAVLRLVLMSIILVKTELGILGLVYVDLLVALISCIILYFFIRNDIKFKFDKQETKKMLQYGIPLVPGRFFNAFSNIIDRYFLAQMLSLSTVGIYSVGFRISQVVSLFLVKPIRLIFPPMAFAIHKEEFSEKYFTRIFTYYVYLGIFICLIISLFSTEILMLMSKHEYLEASHIIPILTVGFLIGGLQQNIQISALIERKTSWVPIVSSCGCAINILLNWSLISFLGIYGSALAFFFTRLFTASSWFLIARKYRKINYEWLKISKIFIAAIILYITGTCYHNTSLIVTILFKSILLILFPVSLNFIGFYEAEEKKRIFYLLQTPFLVFKIIKKIN
jgi:O-antigen/teichoic acid export membrane protein